MTFRLTMKATNIEKPIRKQIAELFAEALGVLSEHRHHVVRQRFLAEVRKLRSLETSSNQISSVLNGMKFFKVKMYPIEDFTESVHFLKEIGDYLHDACEARDKESGFKILI